MAVPSGQAVGRAFLAALAIYAAIGVVSGMAFGFAGKPAQAWALGAILIFGVAYLLAQGLADAAPRVLTRKTALYSAAAAIGYFALQTAADALLKARLAAQVAALLDSDRRLDETRLYQEAVLIAAKADIREELDRIKSHVESVRALLAEGESWCFRTERDTAREMGSKYDEAKAREPYRYDDEVLEKIWDLYRNEEVRGAERGEPTAGSRSEI